MEVEEFSFSFSYKVSTYSLQVKRFLVGGDVHLWTHVKQPRAADRIFNFYETADPHKLFWRPMNDKRDDLMKLLEKSLLKKLNELRKKDKIQTFDFYNQEALTPPKIK